MSSARINGIDLHSWRFLLRFPLLVLALLLLLPHAVMAQGQPPLTPVPGRDPVVTFHASQTEVFTGEPVDITLSVANSIVQPGLTLQLLLQLPSGWTAEGDDLSGCSVQCSAVYVVGTGEARDFRITAVSQQPGSFQIGASLEWYFGQDVASGGSRSETLSLNVSDLVFQEPEISLHSNQTWVTLGDPVSLQITALNPVSNPEMNLQLVLKVPSGWSVSGQGIADSCSGQCVASYRVPPGIQQSVSITMLANEVGVFNVVGNMKWHFSGYEGEVMSSDPKVSRLEVVGVGATPVPTPVSSPPSGGVWNLSSVIAGIVILVVVAFIVKKNFF